MTQLQQEFQQRLRHLFGDWNITEVAELQKSIGSYNISLIGISAMSANGIEVNGSAADLLSDNLATHERAFAELIERIVIVNALSSPRSWTILDGQQRPTTKAGHQDIFPPNPSERQILAKSNGVACGRSWEEATQSAYCELIERHDVLASWFHGRKPTRITTPSSFELDTLSPTYSIACYSFSQDNAAVITTGIFALPKTDSAPLVFGLGAACDLNKSLQKSFREFIQRLGFLWGESIPDSLPEFSPTPYFHQEYYLYPGNRHKIEAWLAGKRETNSSQPESSSDTEIQYVNLFSSTAENASYCVVKALAHGFAPLFFGITENEAGHTNDDIHPIA